jgi:hypothetical protein
MWLDAMLSTGQLRGHGAKVGFFSHAHEGGGHWIGARQTINLFKGDM